MVVVFLLLFAVAVVGGVVVGGVVAAACEASPRAPIPIPFQFAVRMPTRQLPVPERVLRSVVLTLI